MIGSSGRRALVTGGARGIGAAIAAGLAAADARVAICDVAEDVAERASTLGRDVIARRCDVRSGEEVDACVAWAVEELGGLDVIVNNAGVLGVWKLGETSDADWARVLDVNLGGVFRVTRAALPALLASGRGSVISVASITPIRGEALTTAYAASKGGVIGFTKSLAREVSHRGVTVNAIAPGYVMTEQTERVFAGDRGEAIRSQIATGRFAEPEEIASTALFLASDGARYVTGQVFVVDGGVV